MLEMVTFPGPGVWKCPPSIQPFTGNLPKCIQVMKSQASIAIAILCISPMHFTHT